MASGVSQDDERPLRLKADESLADVEEALLLVACTHASYASEQPLAPTENNQRLEFLGDAVLDAVVAEHLFRTFPDWAEGQLTQVKAALVAEPALARAAERLGVGEALRLGRGEETTGGRGKPSLLAGAFEALIAAVFLSGGPDSARRFVLAHLGPQIPEAGANAQAENHKSALQELTQAHMGEAPTYELIETVGPDHQKWFLVEARLRGTVVGRGEGASRKAAETAAAGQALATADEWLADSDGPRQEEARET